VGSSPAAVKGIRPTSARTTAPLPAETPACNLEAHRAAPRICGQKAFGGSPRSHGFVAARLESRTWQSSELPGAPFHKAVGITWEPWRVKRFRDVANFSG